MTNRMAELGWADLEERIAGGAVVLLPVGANESHGPHLPLGTDRICACGFADAIATRLDAVIAPEIPWGFRSQIKTGGGSHWVGNIGLDAEVLVGLVRATIRELAIKGMTRIAIVNGHYENVWFITEGCELAVRDLDARPGGDLIIQTASWWDMVGDDDLAAIFPNPPASIEYEHGALLETSIMMAMRPDLVAADKFPQHGFKVFPPYDVFPQDPARANETGSLATSNGANAEAGAALIALIADRMADHIRTELKAGPARGAASGS
jgi:creatinine amidohydrolase